MKLKFIEIIGLNGSEVPIYLDFNDDLNIITGRNGSGKTTVLKLLWYVISGNLDLLFDEVVFDSISVSTDYYEFFIDDTQRNIFFKEFTNNDMSFFYSVNELNQLDFEQKAQELCFIGSSLIFPTFRRIEGGFFSNSDPYSDLHYDMTNILENVTNELSNVNHKFITGVETDDIENIIYHKYSVIAEEINFMQEELNNTIINKISQSTSNEILIDIKQEIEDLEHYRKEEMKPFTELKRLFEKFFNNKHVTISDIEVLNIGDTANAINSNSLSAGEKQILSFFVYNAFYKDTIFIIDEPEISLHGDWQRMLVPTLLEQNSSNQFILATHSPFIYAKYPDKEVPLNVYRGQND